jgi:hypothetical protein
MILPSNMGALGRIAVLLLASAEWASVLLYVYCLKRFQKNFLVKLIAAIVAISSGVAVGIVQRQLYQPVHSGRLSVHEFDVVVVAESVVSIFILFYGMRRFWGNRTVGAGDQGNAS